MVHQDRDKDAERGNGAGLTASTARDSPELVNALPGLYSASREPLEYRPLLVVERLAHSRDKQDAPGAPAVAQERVAEKRRIGQRAAHCHGGLAAHDVASPWFAARYSARVGVVSRGWRLMPNFVSADRAEFPALVSSS